MRGQPSSEDRKGTGKITPSITIQNVAERSDDPLRVFFYVKFVRSRHPRTSHRQGNDRLFVAQCNHGIEVRGTAGGGVAGQERNSHEDNRDAQKGDRVGGGNSEQ